MKSKKFVTYAKKHLVLMMAMDLHSIMYQKVSDHCHYTGKCRGAAHDIYNLRHKTPKEIPLVFHNGSTYDFHFIIKKLAKEYDVQLECLGENT